MAARRKYDWEEWLKNRLTVIVRGQDYHCSQSTMAQLIRNNASRRGVRVRLTDTGTTIMIEVLREVPRTYTAAVPSQHVAPPLAQS